MTRNKDCDLKQCSVLGTVFAISNIDEAVRVVRESRDVFDGKYICFSNVHTSVMAYENLEYRKVQNGSALTFTDGGPIAKEARKRGFADAQRVAGPDFMEAMFRSTMDGSFSHFFYGSTEETLEKLRENLEKRYPGIRIAGMYAPPFRKLSDLTPEDDEREIEMINASGADFVWVALGAPKQENWMALHENRVHGVMLGVGAGVDFHAGTVRRAPKWMQKRDIEWVYRLAQDPKRLMKRYFETNTKFIWYVKIRRVDAK